MLKLYGKSRRDVEIRAYDLRIDNIYCLAVQVEGINRDDTMHCLSWLDVPELIVDINSVELPESMDGISVEMPEVAADLKAAKYSYAGSIAVAGQNIRT